MTIGRDLMSHVGAVVRQLGGLALGRPVFIGQLGPIPLLPSSCTGPSLTPAYVSDMNSEDVPQ